VKDIVYQKQRVDIVSLEALTAAGFEPDDQGSTERTFIDALTASELYKTLSRRQQQCVDLLLDGYDREEIGQMMGIKHRQQVHRLIHRVRAHLAVLLVTRRPL
jgi:DNA-directed RNA polymerase specialized sigma24 family protein